MEGPNEGPFAGMRCRPNSRARRKHSGSPRSEDLRSVALNTQINVSPRSVGEIKETVVQKKRGVRFAGVDNRAPVRAFRLAPELRASIEEGEARQREKPSPWKARRGLASKALASKERVTAAAPFVGLRLPAE